MIIVDDQRAVVLPKQALQYLHATDEVKAMVRAKLITVDGQRAVVLPQDAVHHLDATGANALLLHRHNPELQRQIEVAEEGMREYRDALRDLAK